MSQFTNALASFGDTQGGAHDYIAKKRDKFFKDYQDRLTSVAQSQAEALGLDQERQEKLSNTIETIGIQAPIIGAAGKKIYTYFANRGATVAASAPTTAASSVTNDVADTAGTAGTAGAASSASSNVDDDAPEEASESPEAVLFGTGQQADSSGDAGDASADAGDEAAGDATELAGDSPEAVLFGDDASAVTGSVVGTGGSMSSVLQGGGLANTSGGFMGGGAASTISSTTAATEGTGTAATAATGALEGGSTAASTAAAASSGASEASGLSAIGSATGSAESATAGSASELILPLAGLAVVGYSLYDLFKPHHSSEQTAPPSSFITGHATGISDAITRGGFATPGLDSVVSLPAQNSAF